jgi:hypothetical protein
MEVAPFPRSPEHATRASALPASTSCPVVFFVAFRAQAAFFFRMNAGTCPASIRALAVALLAAIATFQVRSCSASAFGTASTLAVLRRK